MLCRLGKVYQIIDRNLTCFITRRNQQTWSGKNKHQQPNDRLPREEVPKLPRKSNSNSEDPNTNSGAVELEKKSHTIALRAAPWIGWALALWTSYSTYRGYKSNSWDKREGKLESLVAMQLFNKKAFGSLSYSYEKPDGSKGISFIWAIGSPFKKLCVINSPDKMAKGSPVPMYVNPDDSTDCTVIKGVPYPLLNLAMFSSGCFIFFLPLLVKRPQTITKHLTKA